MVKRAVHPLIPTEQPTDECIGRWAVAAAGRDVDDCLRALHVHIDDVTEVHRPLCVASGRCCRFGEHGHLLAVTGLEALWTLQRIGRSLHAAEAAHALNRGACAFLGGTMCTIHGVRPTGCRTYHCDITARPWQEPLAESVHAAVRDLHSRMGVPYLLAEWTWLLNAIEQARDRGLLGGRHGAYHASDAGV
ncbi:MAG: YkgJ family cysteine cluster protein [Planctomycetota bacterium]|jgi:Fe-S-cluster containining protein